jgi:hypothetical protein
MSMKNYLVIAAVAALSILGANAASAAEAAQSVDLSASVAAFCNVTTSSVMTAEVPVSAIGVVDTAGITFNASKVTCNAPYNVQVTSAHGGIKRSVSAPGGFADIIDYTGTAKLGGAEATLDTSTVDTAFASESSIINAAAKSGSPYSGTLDVAIYPKAALATKPLAAGSFTDTLDVIIAPQ